ncbi:MAG: 2-amino-4-hydroxy-6-hydroxymethyldihydropteridine diphosphokinase [Persicimonas sp.]
MKVNSDNVFVGMGSNLGDRAQNLERAVELIDALEQTRVEAVSSLYETEPRMYSDQPDFLNGCAKIRTGLSARKLLDELLGIEQAMGRIREVENGPRTIDLDILLYAQQIISEEGLEIPHPGIAERGFVLVPLAELAAEVVHPVIGVTIGALLDKCADAGWVRPATKTASGSNA